MGEINHEKYVRTAWEDVEVLCDGRIAVFIRNGIFDHTIFKEWSAAYAFTAKRKKQVRELEEEIAAIECQFHWTQSPHDSEEETRSMNIVMERILAREQAVLADLRRGLKD